MSDQNQHMFSTKRVILPLLFSFIFTIGAMFTFYRSPSTLDIVDVEHEHIDKYATEPPYRKYREDMQNSAADLQRGKQELLDEQLQVTEHEIPNYYMQNMAADKETHWQLDASGEFISCHIENNPLGASLNLDPATFWNSKKEQYVIHIHGLHHTGTGYLRQTIEQALNEEFADNATFPVTSLHNGTFPYIHGLSSIKKFPSPEDEGQHFQNIYPPFFSRTKMFKQSTCSHIDFGRLTYLADECTFDNPQQDSAAYLGHVLLNEWSHFWNTSATFLIQKTPLLDVKFHESVKQLPTLHVILIHHPMTSNAWQSTWMGLNWLDAFTHTFDLLNRQTVDWYAVVSYESLLQYHREVVDELMDVIHSGMDRFGSKLSKTYKRHRRLHLHDSNATMGPLQYLVPKEASISAWKRCMRNKVCKSLLEDLSADVLPHFGFVSADLLNSKEGEDIVTHFGRSETLQKDDLSNLTAAEVSNGKTYSSNLWNFTIAENSRDQEPRLSPNPGLVTVSHDFSHVLFTSESDALHSSPNSVNGTAANRPTSDLMHKMKNILTIYRKKYLEIEKAKSQSKRTYQNKHNEA